VVDCRRMPLARVPGRVAELRRDKNESWARVAWGDKTDWWIKTRDLRRVS
jgi:hypothetical protein